MSVKPETIDNPERDLQLANRDPKGTKKVLDDLERVKRGTPTADDELQALRQRIATATSRVGKDTQPHCGDCFKRGWAAAVREIAGE